MALNKKIVRLLEINDDERFDTCTCRILCNVISLKVAVTAVEMVFQNKLHRSQNYFLNPI